MYTTMFKCLGWKMGANTFATRPGQTKLQEASESAVQRKRSMFSGTEHQTLACFV